MTTFHYSWTFYLKSTPEELWPFISDTNRFNREINLPSVIEIKDTSKKLTNARRILRFSKFGLVVEWIEEPFEWVYPHEYRIKRSFTRGPFLEMHIHVSLLAVGKGTRLLYQMRITPKNLLGKLITPIQIGMISKTQIERLIKKYDRKIQEQSEAKPVRQLSINKVTRQRLNALEAELQRQGADRKLLAKLIQLVKSGDNLELGKIRPYKLADQWHAERRTMLELCLLSTRHGLLEFRWNLICPMCRGAKFVVQSLSQVDSQAHCDTCNMDFMVEFDKSVELTFRPNPNILEVEYSEYCVAGPGMTPHILAQQLVKHGEKRSIKPKLNRGKYRLRRLGAVDGEQFRIEIKHAP